jgi:hypothetical protein
MIFDNDIVPFACCDCEPRFCGIHSAKQSHTFNKIATSPRFSWLLTMTAVVCIFFSVFNLQSRVSIYLLYTSDIIHENLIYVHLLQSHFFRKLTFASFLLVLLVFLLDETSILFYISYR